MNDKPVTIKKQVSGRGPKLAPNQLRTVINDPGCSSQQRLEALHKLISETVIPRQAMQGEVNNHVHTIYSFSPYTPAMAVLRAFESGLDAVGSVDHDSIAAAGETLAAGKLLGIATTIGFELRVSFLDTPFASSRINYPECRGLAYMVVHGVPHNHLDQVEAFLAPLRAIRVSRTQAMTVLLGKILQSAGLPALDFDQQVVPLTKLSEHGGVTERHLLAAAADLILTETGKGPQLPDFLHNKLGITLPATLANFLADANNPHYRYDLIGLLKTTLLDRVFIQPGPEECLPVRQVVEFARDIHAIPAYAYLGDVVQSPTGDKKAEQFEDAYLEELLPQLVAIGFQAITYMPPRNSIDQLRRIQAGCARLGLLEISGVDINSSRQDFNCPEVLLPEFRHLNDSTWALIAHENLASRQANLALFHPANPLSAMPITQRCREYAKSGRAMNPHTPENIAAPILAQ